jgi:hypothetical protein
MNKRILIVSATLLSPTLIACTPDQLNSAIEACKGDPTCYEIIDDAIEGELSSRGISGGKMTNLELKAVEEFLGLYKVTPPPEITPIELTSAYFSNHVKDDPVIMHEGQDYYPGHIYYLLNQYTPNIWWDTFIDLANLNSGSKQLFYPGVFDAKVLIYKTSENNFTYEIWTQTLDTFRIDLNINKLYFNNTLVNIDTTQSLPLEVFDIYLSRLRGNYLRSYSNTHKFGWIDFGESRYLYYHLERSASQSFYSKTHHFHYFNLFDSEAFYLSLSKSGNNEQHNSSLVILKYHDGNTMGNNNFEIIINASISTNTIINFKDFRTLFKDQNIYTEITHGTVKNIDSFLQDLGPYFEFIDLEIDYSNGPAYFD